tara:strand:- start:7067 stop:7648 length:582 start_codon:yes stop_codon:yes gene_type:complete
MFQIDNTIVSESIISEDFVCNIGKCKGECCVSGSAGAPLEKNEIKILDDLQDKISPFLSKKGIKSLKEQGNYIKGVDGEWETPLIDGKECSYTVFDHKGQAQCGIEKAHKAGEINFYKPISCHLYPIRVQNYSEFTAVNYHEWSICDTACSLGSELKIPIYKFVKNALIRRFGKQWYEKLSITAKKWLKSRSQ